MSICRFSPPAIVGIVRPRKEARRRFAVLYMLTFYAVEDEWMALAEDERRAGIAEIGQWFAEHARAGKIVEGRRLARGTKTVRLGRVRKKDLPLVMDGPFLEAKESVGSYAIVQVDSEDEAIAIAKGWPTGGNVEVRPVAE